MRSAAKLSNPQLSLKPTLSDQNAMHARWSGSENEERDQGAGGPERSHVRQRLDGRRLVGHGAIDVTPRAQLDMACGPTGCSEGMHLFTEGPT